MSLSSTRQARPTSKAARRRLAVEPLEGRLTPAISLTSAVVTNYATLSGQPDTTATRDSALDMQVDADGNRYTLGFAGNSDYSIGTFHLTKFNAADNSVAWVTSFNRPDYDIGGAIALDAAGAIYVAKTINAAGQRQFEITKVDAAGQPVPGQTYLDTRPPTNIEGYWGTVDVATDPAGFVYYTFPGHTVKLESKAIGLVKVDDYPIGGSNLDVSPLGDRVYVTGRFSGLAIDFDPNNVHVNDTDKLSTVSRSRDSNSNVYILELHPGAGGALAFAWVGQVGANPVTNPAPNDWSLDIISDESGVYALGYYFDNGGGTNTSTDFDPDPTRRYSLPLNFGGQRLGGNIFLLKLDLNHQLQWVKGLGGISTSLDVDGGGIGQLSLDGQGGLYVADTFNGTDPDFDLEHSYPGNADRPTAGSGSTATNPFVAKYSTRNGAFRWVTTGTASGNGYYGAVARGVAVSGEKVTFFGSFTGALAINPGGASIASIAYNDLFFLTFTQTADPVQVYAKNVVQTEGNTGTTAFTFLLMLSDPVGYDVTVNFATANGTATAGSDYAARTGSVTFLAGETQKAVTVTVTGDTTAEADETFALNLSSPILGLDGSLQALASISNDDALKGKK